MADWPDGLIPLAIHNSDIQAFKSCRQRWNWLSDLREGLKPIQTPTPLSFGSAIHAGLEVYYAPQTYDVVILGGKPRETVIFQAVQTFRDEMRATRARYLKFSGHEALNEDQQVEYEEHLDLGIGMLNHYFEWVQKRDLDKGFRVVDVEVPFEFPIFETYDQQQRRLGPAYDKYIIVFRGRIDLLVQDQWDRYWILDHKTTARMPDRMTFLEMDEQMGSYILGYTLDSGTQCAGAIYSEILKGYPKPLTENKTVRLGRRFSINVNQHTSYDVAKAQLEAEGEDLELYEEFLHKLKEEGTTYVRRTEVPRNTSELRNIAERIKLTTEDMLRDPNIYPSPDRWSCDYCPVQAACLAQMDGRDYQWILNDTTVKAMRTNG